MAAAAVVAAAGVEEEQGVGEADEVASRQPNNLLILNLPIRAPNQPRRNSVAGAVAVLAVAGAARAFLPESTP